MGKLLLLVLIILVLLMVGAVLAFQYFGWVGLLVVVAALVVLVFGLKALAGYALKKAFTAPFKMKGAVLKEAVLEVHSLQPAPAPVVETGNSSGVDDTDPEVDVDAEGREDTEGDDDVLVDDEPYKEPTRWYHMEATITPGPPTGQFTMWEPGEIVLAHPSSKSSDDLDEEDDLDDSIGRIEQLWIWQDGEWVEDDGMKFGGPQKVRFHVGLHDGVSEFRLRYYMEVFGNVRVP